MLKHNNVGSMTFIWGHKKIFIGNTRVVKKVFRKRRHLSEKESSGKSDDTSVSSIPRPSVSSFPPIPRTPLLRF